LGWNFFDIDKEIEAAEKATISEIFSSRGESEFRLIETEMIRQHIRWIERGKPAVLALGGGAFVEAANRALLEDNGITIWLDCPFDVVKSRVGDGRERPLARDPERFELLFGSRRASYSLADICIPIESDDPDVSVEAIVKHPLFR